MNKVITVALIIYLVLTGCKSDPKREEVTVPALSASNLYNAQKVQEFILKYGDKNRLLANDYILRSEKEPLIRKKIWDLKRALTLYPSYKVYKMLTYELIKDKNYNEALESFSVMLDEHYLRTLENKFYQGYIFSEQEAEDLRQYALIAVVSGNSGLIYNILSNQIILPDASDIKEFIEDEAPKYIDVTGSDYKYTMLQFLSEEEVKKVLTSPESFRSFVQSFPDSSQIFEINEQSVFRFDYRNLKELGIEEENGITYAYLCFLPEKKKDPDLYINYNLLNACQIGNQYRVIYSYDTSANGCPKEMRMITYGLAVYSADGALLGNTILGGQNGNTLQVFSVSGRSISTKSWSVKWKEPFFKSNFSNEIISKTISGENKFYLAEDGKITPLP